MAIAYQNYYTYSYKLRNGLCISREGQKVWYKDNSYHRLNGPSFINSSGVRYWYFNGKIHRINGPAIEWNKGSMYYFHGDSVTKTEYKRLIKLEILM